MNEMQGQQQGTQVNAGYILEEYKAKLDVLTDENILQGAYIRQLQAMVKELQDKLDEATTVVEVSDNNNKNKK